MYTSDWQSMDRLFETAPKQASRIGEEGIGLGLEHAGGTRTTHQHPVIAAEIEPRQPRSSSGVEEIETLHLRQRELGVARKALVLLHPHRFVPSNLQEQEA